MKDKIKDEFCTIDDFCEDFFSTGLTNGICGLTNGGVFYFINNYGECNFFLDLRDALMRKFGEENHEFYYAYFSVTYVYYKAKKYFDWH